MKNYIHTIEQGYVNIANALSINETNNNKITVHYEDGRTKEYTTFDGLDYEMATLTPEATGKYELVIVCECEACELYPVIAWRHMGPEVYPVAYGTDSMDSLQQLRQHYVCNTSNDSYYSVNPLKTDVINGTTAFKELIALEDK